MHKMVREEHIDRDCFELFVRDEVYLRFAREFLPEDQVDEVDQGGDRLRLQRIGGGARLARALLITRVGIHRQHDDPRFRRNLPDALRRLDARKARHFDVEHRDARPQRARQPHGLLAVSRLGHHLPAVPLAQQRCQAMPEHRMIVGDEDRRRHFPSVPSRWPALRSSSASLRRESTDAGRPRVVGRRLSGAPRRGQNEPQRRVVRRRPGTNGPHGRRRWRPRVAPADGRQGGSRPPPRTRGRSGPRGSRTAPVRRCR